MSIKKILGTTIVIFSIFPLVFFSFFSSLNASNTLNLTEKNSKIQISKAYTDSFLANLNVIKSNMISLAYKEEIIDILKNDISSTNIVLPSNSTRKSKADKALSNLVSLCPSYRNIVLYTTDFTELICSDSNVGVNSLSSISLLHRLKSTKDFSINIHSSKKTNNLDISSLLIGYPILQSDDNDILGYLIIDVDISYFEAFSKVFNQSNKLMLYNYNDNILYQFLSKDIKKEGTIYPLENTNGKAFYNTLLNRLSSLKESDSSSNSICKSYMQLIRNRNYIVTYTFLPSINLAFITLNETTVAASFLHNSLWILITILSITFIFILFICARITRYYTKPIIDLKNIIQQAADGNLDVKSEVTVNNEIGTLSKSFNKMIHIIKTNYDDLTKMHQTLKDKEEELRNNYEQIEYLAYHDMLTDLPNKLTFHNRINQSLKSSNKNQCHAVFFVDLDNFKTINDTLGHDYGDKLLAETSSRLNSLMTRHDILARAGGDEFLIFRENIESSENAMNFASEILNAFKTPLILYKKSVYISMSIGIAMYPENGISSNTLIKNADIAMYKSKDTGKNKVTLFNKKMQDELSRNAEILEVLRHAIDNNEVFLMYQPQISIITKEIIGYEALMRIQSKNLGLLSPAEFIPIAEDSGLIIELGAWALYEACRFTKELIDEQGLPITVSVNVSSIQLNRAGFFTTLADVLDKTELPPECLELEITESSLLYSLFDAATLFKNFQTLGVKIALDDFGTGYSSLNYLTNMPINTLKIDKSFIDNITDGKKDTYIAETIIRLAHNLNIHVIAEGVEHNSQLDILEKYQCDRIQGYLFSKPLSSIDIKTFVEGD